MDFTACAFLSVIYRRLKVSDLEDLAVATGMTEPRSVDDTIRKDEEAVQNTNESLEKWNSVPWDTDLTILRSPESSLLASENVQEDFLSAKKAGEENLEIFFQERIL